MTQFRAALFSQQHSSFATLNICAKIKRNADFRSEPIKRFSLYFGWKKTNNVFCFNCVGICLPISTHRSRNIRSVFFLSMGKKYLHIWLRKNAISMSSCTLSRRRKRNFCLIKLLPHRITFQLKTNDEENSSALITLFTKEKNTVTR